MLDKNLFIKILGKAHKGGYDKYQSLDSFLGEWHIEDNGFLIGSNGHLHINAIIFDSDFAKAFWGERTLEELQERKDLKFPILIRHISWQWHIQQMALAENRLKYLEKFL